MFEVLRQTGEQRVVAEVDGEVRHAQCIKWDTCEKFHPRNRPSGLKQHKQFNMLNSLRAQLVFINRLLTRPISH